MNYQRYRRMLQRPLCCSRSVKDKAPPDSYRPNTHVRHGYRRNLSPLSSRRIYSLTQCSVFLGQPKQILMNSGFLELASSDCCREGTSLVHVTIVTLLTPKVMTLLWRSLLLGFFVIPLKTGKAFCGQKLLSLPAELPIILSIHRSVSVVDSANITV